MVLQGDAWSEVWLGVELCKGGATITAWVQSGELQREVAGGSDWLARLSGRESGGWSVEGHNLIEIGWVVVGQQWQGMA